MSGWTIAVIVIIFVVPPALVALSLARAAANGDRMMDRLNDTEGDG